MWVTALMPSRIIIRVSWDEHNMQYEFENERIILYHANIFIQTKDTSISVKAIKIKNYDPPGFAITPSQFNNHMCRYFIYFILYFFRTKTKNAEQLNFEVK